VYRQLVKVARAGNKPRLDFNGFYSWKSYDLGAETVHEGFPTPSGEVLGAAWSAGLYLSFPVFDGGRTRGRVTRAESDLSSALLDEAQLTDAIALEVRNAVDAVGENAEIVRAISGTVAQAEKLLAMAEKGFEFGVKTRLDVEDAQLNLLTARGNLARAARDYRVAVTFLDWAMGKL
jgi:HAE1 family hydrophobic/amphiphilic exporter-1